MIGDQSSADKIGKKEKGDLSLYTKNSLEYLKYNHYTSITGRFIIVLASVQSK
jgi:hypothetical protein